MRYWYSGKSTASGQRWTPFPTKRSTLFERKNKFNEGGRKPEALNEKKRTPKHTRKRDWPFKIRAKIKQIRSDPLHPNLGPEKIYPLLKKFHKERDLECPESRTIARIISDDPEKMRIYPQNISHFGRIKKKNRQKVLIEQDFNEDDAKTLKNQRVSETH